MPGQFLLGFLAFSYNSLRRVELGPGKEIVTNTGEHPMRFHERSSRRYKGMPLTTLEPFRVLSSNLVRIG